MRHEYPKSRQELYRDFLEFIRTDIQHERVSINRRMFNAFLWCFLLPALTSTTLLVLVKIGILPMSARGYLDWMVLVFPIVYTMYILGSEVLAQVPATYRRGGISNTLGQSLKESQWRERVCTALKHDIHASTDEWKWIIASFQVDLQSMQYRARYLTLLSGAVFFLLMQGIDSISFTPTAEPVWNKNPLMGWLETSSNDVSQFVGLAIFLVLLYLSGNQTYQSLKRYLHCAELNSLAEKSKSPASAAR